MNESEKERAKLIFGDDEEIALPEKTHHRPRDDSWGFRSGRLSKDRRPGNT